MKKTHTQTQLAGARRILLSGLIVCLAYSSLLARDADAQRIATTISVTFNQAALIKVFRTIEAQTTLTFAYNQQQVDLNQKISLTAENQSVEDVLRELSRQTRLSFKQVNQNILVRSQSRSSREDPTTTVAAFVPVSGTVTEKSSGGAVPGVNVNIAGTTLGTVTDIDGNYRLDMPEERQSLDLLLCGLPDNGSRSGRSFGC